MESFQNKYHVESLIKTTTETVTITKSLQEILLTTSSYRVDLVIFAFSKKSRQYKFLLHAISEF